MPVTTSRSVRRASATVVSFEAPRSLGTYDHLEPWRALQLPLAFAVGLAAFVALPSARQNSRLAASFLGWSLLLITWALVLFATARSRGRTFALEIVLRKQHYLQAMAQGAVFVYWGWYWRQVYDSAPLIAAQLVFAYAFDILLCWSRRDRYTLGFGPFPIIFSTNLFLWFKADWFYLQFLMIAVGLLAKELITWTKDGKRSHIFNPSSFPLGLFSFVLIVTGTTNITWGREVATTLFQPPYIYAFIFLIGLPGQLLFGVTTMTMSAVATTYLFSALFFRLTGTYYFIDTNIPIAVFLGMHLLFTDPSTSPRTELGRIIFGVLYGLSVVVLYRVLLLAGAPTYFDKLMAVPLLNLLIQTIDAAARSSWLRGLDPARRATWLRGRARHAAFIAVWVAVFSVLTATNGLGDSHPGHRLQFWVQACGEHRTSACRVLSNILDRYCDDGSGWACNEYGLMLVDNAMSSARIATAFARACETGFAPGCANGRSLAAGQTPNGRAAPAVRDYYLLLREGKGELPDRTPVELFGRACSQGFIDGCQKACLVGDANACAMVGRRSPSQS
jgi:hypothetical protein